MLSLRKKLVLTYSILILITLVVSAVSLFHFVRLGRSVNEILINNYKSIVAAENMKEALERQDSAATFHIAGHSSQARRQFQENSERFQREYEVAARNITEPGEERIVQDIREQYRTYRAEVDNFLSETGVSANELSRKYFSDLEPRFVHLKNRLDDLLRLNQGAMLAASDRAKDRARRAKITAIAMSGLAIVLASLFTWRFTVFVVDPILRLSETARRISEGELNHHIKVSSSDEIGELASEFNRMMVRLRELRQSDRGRLLLAQKKADAVLHSLYEPVIVTDSKGNILKVNAAAEQVLGIKQDAALAQAAGGERIRKAVQDAVAMQKPVASEEEGALLPLRIGDAERSYRLRTTPMRDEEGKLLGAVTVLEDVTVMRDVDRMKTGFISVASKRLRDPLRSLQLALYSLRQSSQKFTAEQEEMIYNAQLDAETLEDTMNDLLELAEIESGARQLTPKPLRPVDIAREAVARHESAAESKGIALEHKVYPDLSRVVADRRAVRSIMENLISNALDFTERGGKIVISAEEREKVTFFSVRDTGSGIPADKLPLIFGRFVAGGDGRKGTGLGLALVRRLVEAQGGQVSVESKVGEGSVFGFTLPVAAPAPTRHTVEVG